MENESEDRPEELVASVSHGESAGLKPVAESKPEGGSGTAAQSQHGAMSSSMSEPSLNTLLPVASSESELARSKSHDEPSPNIPANPDVLARNFAADTAEPVQRESSREADLEETITHALEEPWNEQPTQHSPPEQGTSPAHYVEARVQKLDEPADERQVQHYFPEQDRPRAPHVEMPEEPANEQLTRHSLPEHDKPSEHHVETRTQALDEPAFDQPTQHSFPKQGDPSGQHVETPKVHAEGEVSGFAGAVAEDTPPIHNTQSSPVRILSLGGNTDLPWVGEVNSEADDPAAFLPEITRSTKFPDVPTKHPTTEIHQSDQVQPAASEESLPQAELEVAHTSERYAFDDETAGEHSPQKPQENGIHNHPAQNLEPTNPFSTMNESQLIFLDNPTDAESRYDEGLPLLAKADSLEGSQPVDFPQQLQVEGHTEDSGNNGGVFEGTAGNVEQDQSLGFSFHPPERKSTEQVLSTLHITSSQEAQGVSSRETMQQPFSDSDYSWGLEGIAESSWPPNIGSKAEASYNVDDSALQITSSLEAQGAPAHETTQQPFPEPDHSWELEGIVESSWPPNFDVSKEEAPYNVDGSASENKDLAAMWQAALEDDDFLDESDIQNDTAQVFPKGETTSNDHPWDQSFSSSDQGLNMSTSSVLQTSGMTAWDSPSTSGLLEGVSQDSWLSQPTHPSMASAPIGLQANRVPSYPAAAQQAPYGVTNPPATSPPAVSQTNYAQQYGQPWPQQQQQQQRRPETTKAQSFADKSKGGYASPYDLPMDISKPRKKAYVQLNNPRITSQAALPPPPPRSSSMYTNQTPRGASEPLQNPYTGRSASISSASQPPLANPYQPAPSSVKPSPTSGSFFEDLPVTSHARRSSNSARLPPQHTVLATQRLAPLPAPATGRPYNQSHGAPSAISQRQQTAPSMAITAEQLRAPERLGLFDSSPQSLSSLPQASTHGARYSPAPPTQPAGQSRAKYAPMPAATPPSNKLPHQPRTFSPLSHPPKTSSHHLKSSSGSSIPGNTSYLPQQHPGDASRLQQPQFATQHYPNRQHEQPMNRADHDPYQGTPHQVQPPVRTTIVPSSPLKQPVNNYTPYNPSGQGSISPPRRSQTQSPSTAQAGPIRSLAAREPIQRPASVNVPAAPGPLTNSYARIPNNIQPARPRGVSHALNYILPNDGRENDPLCRWRGCPIISWGFGGTVVTMFPKHVQRYSTGQQYPSIKCSPGEVKSRSFNNFIPFEEHLARFPGPLRGKGKKKDAIAWLSLRIEQLAREEIQQEYAAASGIPPTREERLLLLKVLRILIEHDGSLAGTDAMQKAVFDVFSAHLQQRDGDSQPLVASSNQAVAPSDIGGSDSLDLEAIDGIRRTLLSGNREGAVWQAVDKRLWGHAMIISSTFNRDIWKQVVQEFVRKELRQFGEDTKSLSALYEIFGGNWEESIDELVPMSARAGYQLINKNTDSAVTRNALEGLEKWAETLMLVLSNRTGEDGNALAALGRLLLGYGRVDAAHICYMFARPFSSFSGSDDPQTSITLVGANHLNTPMNLATETESILFSEVYEFGLTLTSSTIAASVPHLQAYKLYHALLLAQHGYRTEAQQYCDAIISIIKSSTKPSGYHHGLLLAYLDDFSRRLHQSPKDGSTSWKPSMEKVSGSLFAKFSSFIAGDENDNALAQGDTDAGGNDIGPFARIAGNTPSISRPSSQNETRPVYRTTNTIAAGVHGGSSGAANRYTPHVPAAGPYAPQAPHDQEPQRPGSQGLPYNLNRAVTEPAHPVANSYIPSDHLGVQEANSMQSSYSPGAASEGPYRNWSTQGQQNEPSSVSSFKLPNGSAGTEPTTYGYPSYQAEDNSEGKGIHQPNGNIAQNAYQPSSYEPPTQYSGYEPPSGDMDHGYNQDDANTGRRARSTFDDDDDDDDDNVTTRSKKDRAQTDKEADENFRKAAEADAKLDQQKTEKKGWFGGWFGKKESNPATSGPIKAKLGEESSFYYDTELKKWVNKKDGTQQTSSAGTPPPPKGPPVRAPPIPSSNSASPTTPGLIAPPVPPSSNQPPPMRSTRGEPPAGTNSPAPGTGIGTDSGPPAPASETQKSESPAPPAGGPPSRPATSMSNVSSIDDLLGPAGARKGGTVKKAKKGRGYIDVMAAAKPS
ncbi:MAG: vesicle coat component [Peltula sp. TS41687]|nr:MAG: vesicle coat component [Peltula sp. TS41687]